MKETLNTCRMSTSGRMPLGGISSLKLDWLLRPICIGLFVAGFLAFGRGAVAQTCPCVNLVSWWKAEGNANDAKDGNHGALQNGATFAPGKVGQTFSFAGVDEYVSIADSPSLRPTSELTIECWINLAATNGVRVIVAKTVGPGFEKSYAMWLLDGIPNGTVTDSQHSGVHESIDYPLFQPVLGQWYHLAYTFVDSTDTQKLYIDGLLVATKTMTNTIAYDSQPVLIGAATDFGTTGEFFQGQIDELSIYSRALSASEIQAIYTAGATGKDKIPPVITCPPNITISCSSSAPPGVTGTPTSSDNCGTTPTLAFTDSISGGPCPAPRTITRTWTATDDCGNSASCQQVITASLNCVCANAFPMAAWWKAEGNANDSAGSNHGSLVNGTTFGAGRVGQAFSLDGSNDYVSAPDSVSLRPANLTIDGWFNFAATDSLRVLFAKAVGATFLNSYALWLQNGSLRASVADASGSGPELVHASFLPVPGQWYHLAYTHDDGANSHALYVNGAVVASGATTKTIGYDGHPVTIGADLDFGSPASFIQGLIDEVTLYPQALSATAIQAIYLAGAAGKDATPPVLVGVPPNTTVQCGSIPAPASVTATDECDPAPSVSLSESATGACPNAHTLTRTWTATDQCGNSASASQVITVTVQGPLLAVSPAARDFGPVGVGQSITQAFEVVNIGGPTLSGTAATMLPFSVVSGSPYNLAAMQTGSVKVAFTPAAGGNFSNNVAFVSNGGNSTNAVTGVGAVPPSASFSGSPTAGGAPLTVTFTDTSSGTIANRSWDFGDGSTSNTTATTVIHTYQNAGTSTVTLTVTGPLGGDASIKPNYIMATNAPIPLAGLALWLRSDAGTVTSGSALSQWSDQSGNNRHAAQGTGPSQPTLVNSVLNGLPVVRFDGANDFLTFNLPVNGLTGMSLFLVAANTQDQNGGAFIGALNAALFWNESAGWGTVYLSPFQTSIALRFGTGQAGNRIDHNRPTSIGGAFTLTSAIKDGTTDSLYTNGTLVVSAGGKLATIAGCQSTGNVGRGYNDDTFYAGDIAEVLVYDRALTPAERQQVEQLLINKYGLTLVTPPTPPMITQQPSNLVLGQGGSGAFSVTASGTEPLSYQWRLEGSPIGGATSSTYAINNAQPAQAGNYTVVVTNLHGAVTSIVATLTVSTGPPLNGLALWLRADAGTVLNGSAVSQWSDQSGNNRHATQGTAASQPMLVNSVLNGLPVVRFDGANDFLTFNLPVNGLTGMSLFLVAANTQNQNGGGSGAERSVLFWNESGGWGTLYLTPFQTTVALRFGTGQAANRVDLVRPESVGNAFTLTTAIKDGTTDSLYTNGTLAVSAGGKLPTIANCQPTGNVGRGYNNNTFYAGDIAEVLIYNRALTPAERQQVEQILDSKYGLTAPPPPTPPMITQQPSNLVLGQGGSGAFSVGASGTAPLSYQWRLEGSPIGGATSSTYAINNAQPAQAGNYTVVVTNLHGAVTSVVATLTVSTGPPLNGLALWLRADAGTVLNGSAVSQWSDQSGNNRHATQGTAASQPMLVNSVLNGLPVVRFDGANDFLTFNLPVNGLTGMSLFLVAANTQNQNGGGSGAERAALFWDQTANWGTLYLTPFQTNVTLRFGTGQVGNRINHARPASVGGAFTLTSAIKDGTTDSLYTNGTVAVSAGGKLPTIANCQPTGNLGRGFSDTSYAGDIAEVLVYNRALTLAERQQVEQVLRNKYGLPGPAGLIGLVGAKGRLPASGTGLTPVANASPNETDEAPRITSISIEEGVVRLAFLGRSDRDYRVETSEDLIHWRVVSAATLTAQGVFEFSDVTAQPGARFYRVTNAP